MVYEEMHLQEMWQTDAQTDGQTDDGPTLVQN